MQSTDHTEMVKNVVDASAATLVAATMMKWLPPIAALLTVIWTGLRIYDWISHKLASRKEKK